MFDNEKEMQAVLSDFLQKTGSLSEIIEPIIEEKNFTFEYEKIISSYKYCIDHLVDNVIISEEKNISIFENEELKPDFLLYSPMEAFVLIELKNNVSASRQAGTELIAYSNTLKSNFSFMSDDEVILVIISTKWNTLLSNYLFNEIVCQQKKVLCLEPISKSPLKLQCYCPKKLYKSNSKLKFNERSFAGLQYCIYGKGIYYGDKLEKIDENINQINASFERIVRLANRKKSHGFAFLWKDFRECSVARYSITYVDINPFERFQGRYIFIKNKIDKIFYENYKNNPSSGNSFSTIKSACNADKMLSSIANPTPEGSLKWLELKKIMLENSDLLSFKSWGVIADLYDEFLIKKYDLGNQDHKYDCPEIGLEFLESIINQDDIDDADGIENNCLYFIDTQPDLTDEFYDTNFDDIPF